MTPLRQRLIEDLQIRNYAPRTIQTYVAGVAKFARHFKCSPAQLGREHIRSFQLHLIQQKASWSQFNQVVCALRFLYDTTLGQPNVVEMVPYGKKPKTLPTVLSQEEVKRLFDAALTPRDRLLFRTAYAAGLRVAELVRLRLEDIDSARMVIHVVQGKGHKDRQVPLSNRLLDELRDYWQRYRPKEWLFPGLKEHLSICLVQKMCIKAVRACGFRKKVSMHTLRHSYATHLLEAGIDLLTLQRWLGHSQLSTTARYIHVRSEHRKGVSSPLDVLPSPKPTQQQ